MWQLEVAAAQRAEEATHHKLVSQQLSEQAARAEDKAAINDSAHMEAVKLAQQLTAELEDRHRVMEQERARWREVSRCTHIHPAIPPLSNQPHSLTYSLTLPTHPLTTIAFWLSSVSSWRRDGTTTCRRHNTRAGTVRRRKARSSSSSSRRRRRRVRTRRRRRRKERVAGEAAVERRGVQELWVYCASRRRIAIVMSACLDRCCSLLVAGSESGTCTFLADAVMLSVECPPS